MRVYRIVLVLLTTVAAVAGAADQPRSMTAVDLLSVLTQSEVQLAPGGSAAARPEAPLAALRPSHPVPDALGSCRRV